MVLAVFPKSKPFWVKFTPLQHWLNLCLLAHRPFSAALHKSGFHPQCVQTFSISNLFHWLCIFFYFSECIIMRFYCSDLYRDTICMGLVLLNLAFSLIIFALCSFMMTFLYPSQRPDTHIEIYVVQSNCWDLLWSSNWRSSKTSNSVLEWGGTSCYTGRGDGTWLPSYTLLIFLASLMRSHGKLSTFRLLKILVREWKCFWNVARLSDAQRQSSPFSQ